MTFYYLNLNGQPNGDHEVHKESCRYYYEYKKGNNFELLGVFSDVIDALKYAKKKHSMLKIDGCEKCCKKAHKS